MEISTKTKVIAAAVALGLAFGLGYYVTPTKTTIKTEIKEVIKEVEKKHTDQQNDVVTVEVETRYPDGTVKIERKIVDKGHIVIDDTRKKDQTTDTSTTTVVERGQASWNIAALTNVDLSDRKFGTKYGLHVQRRIIGPVQVGAFGMTDGTGGVSIGISF
jgi:uncharacterized protein YqgV (UPF0045/DUF77 family)